MLTFSSLTQMHAVENPCVCVGSNFCQNSWSVLFRKNAMGCTQFCVLFNIWPLLCEFSVCEYLPKFSILRFGSANLQNSFVSTRQNLHISQKSPQSICRIWRVWQVHISFVIQKSVKVGEGSPRKAYKSQVKTFPHHLLIYNLIMYKRTNFS